MVSLRFGDFLISFISSSLSISAASEASELKACWQFVEKATKRRCNSSGRQSDWVPAECHVSSIGRTFKTSGVDYYMRENQEAHGEGYGWRFCYLRIVHLWLISRENRLSDEIRLDNQLPYCSGTLYCIIRFLCMLNTNPLPLDNRINRIQINCFCNALLLHVQRFKYCQTWCYQPIITENI